MLRETTSDREGNLLDVIARTAFLRLAARQVRPRIVRGNAMVRSCHARAVANLGIASALTIFLGACGSMSLPSLSSAPTAAPEPAAVPEMPATIRPEETGAGWGFASYKNPPAPPRTGAAEKAQ